MPAKRPAAKAAAGPASTASSPAWNAAAVAGAITYGLWLLVERGRISWPPHELAAGASTVAGALAIAGPLVLGRRRAAPGETGLGELIWLTAGLLVWVFDLAALARGDRGFTAWVNPLGVRPMGLTVLAVGLAGWRANGLGRGWTWTNIVGWLLGALWVGLAAASLWASRASTLAMR